MGRQIVQSSTLLQSLQSHTHNLFTEVSYIIDHSNVQGFVAQSFTIINGIFRLEVNVHVPASNVSASTDQSVDSQFTLSVQNAHNQITSRPTERPPYQITTLFQDVFSIQDQTNKSHDKIVFQFIFTFHQDTSIT